MRCQRIPPRGVSSGKSAGVRVTSRARWRFFRLGWHSSCRWLQPRLFRKQPQPPRRRGTCKRCRRCCRRQLAGELVIGGGQHTTHPIVLCRIESAWECSTRTPMENPFGCMLIPFHIAFQRCRARCGRWPKLPDDSPLYQALRVLRYYPHHGAVLGFNRSHLMTKAHFAAQGDDSLRRFCTTRTRTSVPMWGFAS